MKNEKGFTLIELTISIAVLAILIVPFFGIFTNAAKLDSRSKNDMTANYLAQKLIAEERKNPWGRISDENWVYDDDSIFTTSSLDEEGEKYAAYSANITYKGLNLLVDESNLADGSNEVAGNQDEGVFDYTFTINGNDDMYSSGHGTGGDNGNHPYDLDIAINDINDEEIFSDTVTVNFNENPTMYKEFRNGFDISFGSSYNTSAIVFSPKDERGPRDYGTEISTLGISLSANIKQTVKFVFNTDFPKANGNWDKINVGLLKPWQNKKVYYFVDATTKPDNFTITSEHDDIILLLSEDDPNFPSEGAEGGNSGNVSEITKKLYSVTVEITGYDPISKTNKVLKTLVTTIKPN
ncbi:MAG: prepilin-type N-terminal cleavage/methylation domain-containing protein [Peptostreptococcaceae bacterium]|nr:prepilin-type N-terminal cleavage/methylation domain-containing protein [Peptostreptococcaceae bacterium]